MTINFYLNNDKKSIKTEKALFCYVRETGKTISLHTGERIEPKYWDVKGQKAKRSYIGHPELNDFLVRYKEKIKEIIRKSRIDDPAVPFDIIKKNILKELSNKTEYDFFSIFESFINLRKPIVSKATTVKFTTIKRQISDFVLKNKFDVSLDTIDLNFFDKLHHYFLSIDLSDNTIHKNMQFIKSFLRWTVERDYTKNTKFENFKNVKLVETDNIALTVDDLEKLINCENLSERLDRVRDVFLFQLYTGQRYSDIQNLTPDDIRNKTWHLRQEKTKKVLEIGLIDQAIEILEKYNNILPVITNQKMNDYLKELGQVAGLNDKVKLVKYKGSKKIEQQYFKYELLTTHTARRSFVSIASYKRVNPMVVKSYTGHGTDKMVSKYFKSNTEDNRKNIDDVFKK